MWTIFLFILSFISYEPSTKTDNTSYYEMMGDHVERFQEEMSKLIREDDKLLTGGVSMYNQTPEQVTAEKRLNKIGFRFSHWIPESPDDRGEPCEGTESRGVMVMIKTGGTTRYSQEYKEIEPTGVVH